MTQKELQAVIDYFSPLIADNSGGYDRKHIIDEFKKLVKVNDISTQQKLYERIGI